MQKDPKCVIGSNIFVKKFKTLFGTEPKKPYSVHYTTMLPGQVTAIDSYVLFISVISGSFWLWPTVSSFVKHAYTLLHSFNTQLFRRMGTQLFKLIIKCLHDGKSSVFCVFFCFITFKTVFMCITFIISYNTYNFVIRVFTPFVKGSQTK